MAGFIVIYDACVLYPAPLRDFLISLALTDLFQARWTHAIHDEWIRNLLLNRPDLQPENLWRTRDLMDRAVPDCLIDGFEQLIPGLTLPDPDDRHVLAAAIRGGASVIVSFNKQDFPAKVLDPWGIEVQHPDVFCSNLCSLNLRMVCDSVRKHRTRLKNPPKLVDEYLLTLEQQGLVRTVACLREFAGSL